MKVDVRDGEFCVDATLLARLLELPPGSIPGLMRSGAITGTSEQGIDADAGTFRLTFRHGSRRARLCIDADGNVLRRSSLNFGDRAASAPRPPAAGQPPDASTAGRSPTDAES